MYQCHGKDQGIFHGNVTSCQEDALYGWTLAIQLGDISIGVAAPCWEWTFDVATYDAL